MSQNVAPARLLYWHMKTGGTLRLVKPEPLEGAVGVPSVPALYQLYSRYVASIAAKLLGREDEVKDVVQDVFVAAMEHLDELHKAESVKGWLAAIAVNKATSRLRRRKVRAMFGLDSGVHTPPAHPASPEQAAYLAQLYKELDQLPVSHRVAWTLRYVQEEPLEEVAKLCACSLATAKRWIASAQEAIVALEAKAGASGGGPQARRPGEGKA
ncbi:MAG: RNA polymerase sigma factor [Deltaproteobacteria bacterium]|nr:RNA polymerase sigma factor [Deltaproteobacteria bacterium]